ncbi:MAG TPA: hypothetical protein VFE04_10520, partial [Puia sp.]|nr:hypothetical protein [Puia sp.]
TVEPRKWTNLFLIFIALEYLRAIFVNIRNIARFIKFTASENQNGFHNETGDFYFFLTFAFEVTYIIYIPVLLYLLYRKKKWGWILLFADQIISFLLSIGNTYFLFKYQSLFHAQTAQWLFWIFLRAAFIYFLWQDKVTSYFNVPQGMKVTVVMGSILIYLVFLSFLKILFY